MTKRKTPREFSYSFKLQVLIDYYSSGSSQASILRKWNVSSGSMFQWLKRWPVDSKSLSLPWEVIQRYRMAHKETNLTDNEILRQKIVNLQHALSLEKMRSRAYEKLIEIAESEEGISILKKDGAKQ